MRLQGVLVQGSPECRQLYTGETHWKGVLWQGLSRVTQAHQWLQGNDLEEQDRREILISR
jgi:hypothetical protein